MFHADTINLADHEAALALWKEAASDALSAYEDERRKRIEAEQTAARYAQRVADAEQAMAVMIDDLMKRGEMAEAIGNVMRFARDYANLRTDTAWAGLVRSLREYDELRKVLGDGRQT